MSFAKRITSIITNNSKNRLKELKEHLLDRKHSLDVINYSFTNITFIRTYNSNYNINLKKFHSCLDKIEKVVNLLSKKKVLLSTRQHSNLLKLLTTAKFERLLIPKSIKQVKFFPLMRKLHLQ